MFSVAPFIKVLVIRKTVAAPASAAVPMRCPYTLFERPTQVVDFSVQHLARHKCAGEQNQMIHVRDVRQGGVDGIAVGDISGAIFTNGRYESCAR
jgi:hypothetical protein